MLGRLDEIQEADDVLLEPLLQLRVGDPPVVVECLVRLREREHVRVDARAEVLERDAQRPEAAVAADHRRRRREQQAVAPLNGCGRKRDTQSIAFLSTPGIDALYSGDAIMNASLVDASRSASAPAGKPSLACTSPS